MKIERINENKIKCTLTREEMDEMNINFNELAYGTEKAKDLFRDLMDRAKEELGFDADDGPLMIEAVPVKPDSLMLIITKVSSPEELKNRIPTGVLPVDDPVNNSDEIDSGIDGTIDEVPEFEESDGWEEVSGKPAGKKDKIKEKDALYTAFAFDRLKDVIEAAHVITAFYDSNNSLYTNPRDKRYYLLMYRNRNTQSDFKKAGLKAGEYGREIRLVYNSPDYFDEYFRLIIKDTALQRLAELN